MTFVISSMQMDPTYPEERLAIYAEDAKAAVVLTQEQHENSARQLAGDAVVLVVNEGVLCQDEGEGASQDASQNLSTDYCNSESTSLVLFTSGSTGRPKGVQHAHRHLRELLLGTCNYFDLNEEDVIILTNTICFDVHALQIFAPLAVGAKLILAKPGGHTDGDYICSLIWEHRVTGFIFTVPFLANEYLNSKLLQAPVPFMKHWGMGGDAVPLEIVHRMKAAFPAMVENGPVNSYGPTEGNVVTQHRFPNNATGTPIGRPDDNIHCMVVDSAMHPVPVGVPGELLLSGPRLAVGYIGRPDLTAEKFVPNPCFDAMTQTMPEILRPHYKRAYRTGDLVRWRSDGNLEYLGRIDRQVKISGVRVELGEVEAALASSPEVIKAVAAAVADEYGVKRLVGYVTPEDVDPSEVLAHCVGRLMAAMVPSVVVPLTAFPLLPNGKVDVRSLPVPDWSSMGGSEEYVPPANDIEQAVQAVFADILGRQAEELSVLTDFFAAGGTSLQVFRVTAALQKALELEGLPSSLVHNARTVRATAAALQELRESDTVVEKLPPLTARNWPDPTRPLSPSQEVYWYNAKLRGAGANNMPVTLEFSGRLSVFHLQQALDAVAARHEILRMHYIEPSPNKPMAYITPVDKFSTPIRKKFVSQDDLKTAVVADLSEKFELEKGPLFRCSILEDEKDPEFSVLIVNMHHTLGDGWSMAVLARELAEAYNASLEGKEWSPEQLPISYFDYAAWQRDYLAAGALQERLAHWQQKFSGLPETPAVVPDFERTESFQGLGDSVRLDFDPSLSKALATFAKRKGLNMQALMLRACELAMHEYTGRDDFIFIIPMALRNQIETHNLIGFLINAVPVRHKIKKDEDTVSAARALGREVQESLAKNLPHGFIVRNIQGLRPHLQLMFQYINVSEVSARAYFGQLESRQLRSELVRLTHAKTEIFFHLSNTGMAVEYYTELFDRSKIEKLAHLVLASLKETAGVA